MLSISVIIPDPYELSANYNDNAVRKNNHLKKKSNSTGVEKDDSLWLSTIYEIWETKDIFYDINMRINNFNSLDVKNIKEGIRILGERKTGDTMSKIICDHFQMILDTREREFFYKKDLLKKNKEMHENLSEKITQLQIDIEMLQLDVENRIVTYENAIDKIELIDIQKNLIISQINLLKTMGSSDYDIKILIAYMKGVYNELSKLLTIFHIKK